MTETWTIGSITVQRVPYFDIALGAESIGIDERAESVDWAEPWLTDGQPTVGQAFWVIRSGATTMVVDPCGASDEFLRTGPEAVDHQTAAFAAFTAAGCDPAEVDLVVLTHLDGIGMVALADGAAAGEESWSPAFPNASVIVSEPEYAFITADDSTPPGLEAFMALDRAGVVTPVAPPHQLAPGVTLRFTGAHSPGHCDVEVTDGGERAELIGHLAISPLHAAAGPTALHVDGKAAWAEFSRVLDSAAAADGLVMGSLWPAPGAARVVSADPYVLVPAPA